jgi:hypothetical protein
MRVEARYMEPRKHVNHRTVLMGIAGGTNRALGTAYMSEIATVGRPFFIWTHAPTIAALPCGQDSQSNLGPTWIRTAQITQRSSQRLIAATLLIYLFFERSLE